MEISHLLRTYDQEISLKTISGDIDVTVPAKTGLGFKAKTISGEIYSDLEITYPEGKPAPGGGYEREMPGKQWRYSVQLRNHQW